jgi:hypothetical protein
MRGYRPRSEGLQGFRRRFSCRFGPIGAPVCLLAGPCLPDESSVYDLNAARQKGLTSRAARGCRRPGHPRRCSECQCPGGRPHLLVVAKDVLRATEIARSSVLAAVFVDAGPEVLAARAGESSELREDPGP